jgi:hypothetical protein
MSYGRFSGRSPIEKSGSRPRNQSAKNYSSSRYQYSLGLENSSYTATLCVSHPASANALSSRPSWKGVDSPLTSLKINWKRTVCSTDEERFTGGGTARFHNTHVLGDDNLHIDAASRYQHWFSISAWVETSCGQHLRAVVLPNRIPTAVSDLAALMEHVPLHQGSWMNRIVRQHLNQTSVSSGYGAEAESTGLHDPLTLILWIFGCGIT